MIVAYRQPDGSTKIFGHLMPDGPLTAATGQLLRGWHSKCFHIVRKREARGDAVTGRVLGDRLPTGYDIAGIVLTRDEADALGAAPDTRYLSERLAALRAVAQRVGKPIGDPEVTEAFRAAEQGGPYPHTHDLPLETYQLLHHLCHAHGLDWVDIGARAVHAELHARAALDGHRQQRADDPGETPTEETDWREQVAVDVEHLK